ncbi:hypothetical protein Q3G72_030319 [Acer saccharum]|nr:hypothetical protein Q3G72_030319 [Acer saccharum]
MRYRSVPLNVLVVVFIGQLEMTSVMEVTLLRLLPDFQLLSKRTWYSKAERLVPVCPSTKFVGSITVIPRIFSRLTSYDDAIQDNVDVITFSIGLPSPASYFEDAMAIGAYHAFKNGIVVVASAGNDRHIGSVVSVAPWMITVAASTIDR